VTAGLAESTPNGRQPIPPDLIKRFIVSHLTEVGTLAVDG